MSALRGRLIYGAVRRSAASQLLAGSADRLRSLATVAGIIAPLLLAAVFLALTIEERSFLRSSGWSAIHRTEVEWPSVLELGAHGWVMQVALVAAAGLGLVFAFAIYTIADIRALRVGVVALGVMSLGVAAMALPPDPLRRTSHSWQDVAHNSIYPLIPAGALLAAIAFSYGSRRGGGCVFGRSSSMIFVLVGGFALAASSVAAIAQLARFVFFGVLLEWILVLALRTRGSSQRRLRHDRHRR